MLWCSWIDDGPHENLAKFGNTQDMKVNIIQASLYIEIWHCLWFYFFLKYNNKKNLRNQKEKFFKNLKFPPKKCAIKA
jgi:hypothetical protein